MINHFGFGLISTRLKFETFFQYETKLPSVNQTKT